MFVQNSSKNILIFSGSMVLLYMMNLLGVHLFNDAESQVDIKMKPLKNIQVDPTNRPFNPPRKGAPKRTADAGSRAGLSFECTRGGQEMFDRGDTLHCFQFS